MLVFLLKDGRSRRSLRVLPCPMRDCQGMCRAVDATTLECCSCVRVMCKDCGRNAHPGETCAQSAGALDDSAFLSLGYKRCPTCKIWVLVLLPVQFFWGVDGTGVSRSHKFDFEVGLNNLQVERREGCAHITCPCGCHFCYNCGKGFKTSGECYQHMGEAHGGMY
jgi:hypothetical protein